MKTLPLKYLASLLLIFGYLLSCQNTAIQNDQSELKNTIIQAVKAFKEKDAATLNQLISPAQGLYVIFRPGVFDIYSKTDIIDFDNPIPEYFPYGDFSTDYDLKFESLPTYDCDSMKWSKSGLYCDATILDHLLSTTAENMKKYELADIPESEIQALKEMEENSRRIVLSDGAEGELVFYLTLINQKWYLTIIDRVTSDCSA